MTPPPPEPQPAGVPLKVLYVEDDAINIELMRYVMELRPQVHLEIATDGLAGVAAAMRIVPDLVLLDMDLPLLNGTGVLQALRADPRLAQVPCVAVSANSVPSDIQAAMDAGFKAYFVKPFAVGRMLALVDSLLPAPPAPPAP
jgi:CheY-like chemotaxis protein